VEVLAALVFMGIVIPVAINAVSIAGLAGEVAERKGAASRVADRVLNELLVTDGLRQSSSSGEAEEGTRKYNWTMESTTWTVDSLNLVTVTVTFEARGREYDVSLSTLFDPAATPATTLTTTSTQ
jgi:hypothetical protein